jgi:hypothetical protein
MCRRRLPLTGSKKNAATAPAPRASAVHRRVRGLAGSSPATQKPTFLRACLVVFPSRSRVSFVVFPSRSRVSFVVLPRRSRVSFVASPNRPPTSRARAPATRARSLISFSALSRSAVPMTTPFAVSKTLIPTGEEADTPARLALQKNP